MLEEQLRLMRIEKYGAGGEKLCHAQMELFALEPVLSEVTEQAKSEYTPVRCSTTDPTSIRAARNCLRSSSRERILPAHRISACARVAAKKLW